MEFNQASVFFLGLCGVSKDRLGNIHLGNVNLGTGEGVTDKCLSVHILKVIAKNIPQDNYFVCNVRPMCILKKDGIHCKECDQGECWNMVELLAIFNNFMKEIDGRLCLINVGGRSTEKIGEALLSSGICSAENVHSTGFHLCTLGTYQANMHNQKFECTQFVKSIHSFLNAFFGSRIQLTILDDCINDKRMRYVVKMDPATMDECEEHRKQRFHASRLLRNARRREWYANLLEDRKEEVRARRRELYANLSEDRKVRARRRELYREWYANLSEDQKAEEKARKQRWFANLSEERKAGIRMRNKILKLKWWDNMCEEKKNVHHDTWLEYNQKKRNTMTDEH